MRPATMQRPYRRQLTSCWRLSAAIVCTAAFGPALPAMAAPSPDSAATAGAQRPAPSTPVSAPAAPPARRAVPAGFEDLDAPQSAHVDVLFGGTVVGTAQVTISGATFTFDAPANILPLLPTLTQPAAILAELGRANLPVNAHLLCRTGADQTTCERLSPDRAGFILDRDRFRVLVFVAPAFLALKDNVASAYLPAPEPGTGLINAVSAVVSGSAGQDLLVNLENQLVIGDGQHRIRADFGYATGLGTRLDTLRAELDRPGWRYTAGALWSRAGSFTGRRQFIGVEAATQTDTRLDKENLKGSPLSVFLEQRSRVDILRDGRILASRIYDAGNQLLDTSTLPDGVYEVTLRILAINGALREERQFFSKNAYMPAPGQTMFHGAAGLLVSEHRHALPEPTGTPFLQAGLARRVARNLAVDLSAMASDQAGVIELGGTFQSHGFQLRAATLMSSRGEHGVLAQLGSYGTGALNFSLDLRHVATGKSAPGLTAAAPVLPGPGPASRTVAPPGSWLLVAPRTFTQATGSVSYNLPGTQVQANGYYRRERGYSADYSIGPSLRVNLFERAAWQVTFNADAAFTSRGKSGYVGLNLQLLQPRSSFMARAGARLSTDTSASRRSAGVGALTGAVSRTTAAGELEMGGGYEREVERDILNLSAQLRGEKGNLGAQVSKGLGGQGTPLQYSLGLQTTIAAGGRALALTGTRRGDGAVLLKVDSDAPEARFEVLLNEAPSGEFAAGEQLALTLPAYRTYDVRIRPVGKALMQIDTRAKALSLFPGSVVSLGWQASRQVPVFGQLVLPGGIPVRFAAIRAGNTAAMTDETGFFQLETSVGSVIEASLPGNGRCQATIPALPHGTRYAKLGQLECRSTPAPPRLGIRR